MSGSLRPAINAKRRRLFAALGALLAYPNLSRIAFAAATGKSGVVAEDLDAFIRLSEIIAGTRQLDRDTAMQILEVIRAEPWGKEHLAQIAAKLMPSLSDSPLPADRQALLDPKRFSDGERWFIGHLLTTWFTGIYYHQSGNHVVSYKNALMHAALEDVRPVPGHCNGVFGFWSEPPQGITQ
ncbi:MAG: sugar dehydrogenase complex small subunit [Gallionellaceae bacterium]|nr:sugar dehydrogenase complex small subunit [Gallionellaceae bacterium]